MESTGKGWRMERSMWRGVAVLAVAGVAVGALAITPATGAASLTKKRALKLFYTKGQAEARFLDLSEGNSSYMPATVLYEWDLAIVNNTPDDFEVDCPANTSVVGGGALFPVAGHDFTLTDSFPSDGTDSQEDGSVAWTVGVDCPDCSSSGLFVYATCLRASAVGLS